MRAKSHNRVTRTPADVSAMARLPGSATWHLEAAPIIKRAGGKTKLLPQILARLPGRCRTYYEPFLGGGAVLFAYGPNADACEVNDADHHLVDTYRTIREWPVDVFHALESLFAAHTEATYYEIRDDYNNEIPGDSITRAAQYLYLNRTGYNGLWRVNKKTGALNVPFGRYAKLNRLTIEQIEAVHNTLESVVLHNGGWQPAIQNAGAGDVVYADPPYPDTFDSYTRTGFYEADHCALAVGLNDAARRGAHVLLSISDCRLARELYDKPHNSVTLVKTRHTVSCKSTQRGDKFELLINVNRR